MDSRLKIAAYLLVTSIMTSVLSGQSLVNALTSQLCGMVSAIRSVVGALAIALFLLGGIMYAIAHFLPTSLEYRKNLMGWATAMIIGGVIGLIVVIIANPIVRLIANFGNLAGGNSVTLPC